MKPKSKWSAGVLQSARKNATALPWAGRKDRAAWRRKCRKRALA